MLIKINNTALSVRDYKTQFISEVNAMKRETLYKPSHLHIFIEPFFTDK